MIDPGFTKFNTAVRQLLALTRHDLADAKKFAAEQLRAAQQTKNPEQLAKLTAAAEHNMMIVDAAIELHRVAADATAKSVRAVPVPDEEDEGE